MVDQLAPGVMDEREKLALHGFRTVVVDDEPDIADLAGTLLSFHGIDALVVYSAYDALKLLESRSDIDAIFTDVTMPAMTGLQLAETVAENHPSIKIVLTSGFTALKEWDRHGRPFLFATKPYSIATVIRLLQC